MLRRRSLVGLVAVLVASSPSHAATARVELPLSLPSTTSTPAREAIRARLVASSDEALRSATDRASRDLFTTMRDVFARKAAPDRVRGLGATVLRVGFVHQIDSFVQEDVQCTGVPRLDAVHEGVARGILGSALGLARGSVTPDCEAVAGEAEVDASRGAFAALAMPARDHVRSANEGLTHVWSACGAATLAIPPAAAPTLDAADGLLRRLQLARAHLLRTGAPLAPRCRVALDTIAEADPLALARVADLGLGPVRLSTIAAELDATAFDCTNDPTVCRIHQVVGDVAASLVRGGATPAVLRAAISALVARTETPGRAGLAHVAVRALADAMVTPRGATLDPDLLLATLAR